MVNIYKSLLMDGEHNFTKYMFLDQHLLFWSWNSIPINQSNMRNNFTDYVKFKLTARVWCFYISVINISFPYDFRENVWGW